MAGNKWVGYLDRSYQQIKASLLSRLTSEAPEITDHSSTNILVIIIEMFAGVSEMLGLYIDNMAREAFIMTCRRFASMVKLVKLIDYRVKAGTPSSADLTLTFDSPIPTDYTIPAGTEFTTGTGLSFLSPEDVLVKMGSSSVLVPVKQWTLLGPATVGTTDGTANQAILLPEGYVHDTAMVKVAGVVWTLQQTLGLSKPWQKHFIVEVDIDGRAYIVFGDNLNGAIPPIGSIVTCMYYSTTGNNTDANTIVNTGLVIPGISTITTTNYNNSYGGSLVQTIDQIRYQAPRSIRTLDRAVTRQDYVDIARLCPGVGKAALYFKCGKTVDIYVVPIGGGIAPTPLLQDVVQWFDPRRMVTTKVRALAAGQTRIKGILEVRARFREDVVNVSNKVSAALVEFGKYENQDINKPIRLSDIIALVDNLPEVDYVNFSEISSIPYAKPVNHFRQLNWVRHTLPGSTVKSTWRIEYNDMGGVHTYRLFRNNLYMSTIPEAVLWVSPDNDVSLNPNPGAYTHGKYWEFTVYPYNKDIVLDDYTIPVINPSDLAITVIPTYSAPIE